MKPMLQPGPVAAVAHVYYEEMWPELAWHLRHMPTDFTLFATIPEDGRIGDQIIRDFPTATVVRVANRGRDVAPFLSLLPHLQRFDAVCKIHTKRSIYGGGWRSELLHGVLGSRRQVSTIVRAFAEELELAIAGPRLFYLDGHAHLYGMRPLLEKYGGLLPDRFAFFGGTMFWMRPKFFAEFGGLFPQSDFVPHLDNDFHPEHAAERLFGLRATQLKAKIGLTDTSRFGRPRLSIVPATELGALTFPKGLNSLVRRRRRKDRLRALVGLPGASWS